MDSMGMDMILLLLKGTSGVRIIDACCCCWAPALCVQPKSWAHQQLYKRTRQQAAAVPLHLAPAARCT